MERQRGIISLIGFLLLLHIGYSIRQQSTQKYQGWHVAGKLSQRVFVSVLSRHLGMTQYFYSRLVQGLVTF